MDVSPVARIGVLVMFIAVFMFRRLEGNTISECMSKVFCDTINDQASFAGFFISRSRSHAKMTGVTIRM